MPLAEYRRKRHFDRTPEPAGAKGRSARARRLFVVQKHDARNLHYDFRLEADGVLKSWAVPKGPSLDPKEKRLAVEVEDHPLEYGDFEGVIPEGEYGGGTVLLWDRGWWRPAGDVTEGLRRGRLKFELHGEKLRGGWNLVRLRAAERGKPNWLLIKESDDEARPTAEGDVLVARPESVASGKDLRKVASERKRVWRSNRRGGDRELPEFVAPQLATLVSEAPAGGDWLHEIKLDGYRVLAAVAGDAVRLWTRSGQDWTDRFPAIAEALAARRGKPALYDGEVVALDAKGRSSFQALQNALGGGADAEIAYFVFDLLAADGEDLRKLPLRERKARLAARLKKGDPAVRFSDHVAGRGAEFHARACRLGLEGIISKRAAAPYRSGRGKDWLKVKCSARQELVIVGFTEPRGSRSRLGALLLAVWEGARLRFAGKVGTGFGASTLADLYRRLSPLERDRSDGPDPRLDGAPRGAAARGVHWVEPRLVAEISFTEWTDEGLLRHPSFEGLREDKPAKAVRREGAAPAVAGVVLSNPGRVLYPEQGSTKLDLARYYEAVAEWVLPHARGRLLTLMRCPEGRAKACFYQKHFKEGTPPAVRSADVREEGGKREPYLYVDDLAGLVSLVQIGALELHGWGSTVADLERPDRLVFDLDPDPSVAWKDVVAAARLARKHLEELGLSSFVLTTGGKGLHVVVPLEPKARWPEVKEFARRFAEALAQTDPRRFVTTASKAARRGRIYIDWLRNARGATAILPYSTRARPGATVAMPLAWEALGRQDPKKLTIKTVPKRLRARTTDPWADYRKKARPLPEARS
jgi:bifunctional non-homologous end joining protein LigD